MTRNRPRVALVGALVLAACGPPLRIHPDPETACADLSLAGQDDVAAAAGCRVVGSVSIRTGMALDLSSLRQLRTIRGTLSIGPTVGLAEVVLPRLTDVRSIRIVSNGNLTHVVLPMLATTEHVEVEGNGALSILKLSALRGSDRISIADNDELEVLDLSALAEVRELAIHDNPKLTVIDAAALRLVHTLTLDRLPSLPDDQATHLRAVPGR
jgi:hypothetical protein